MQHDSRVFNGMNATQQLLTDHIDIWTAADTAKKSGLGRSSGNAASVYGIKKLRELILELAVRGKLVPQDPNDEPATELLKRIQAEKAKLIAEGKIKKSKSPLTPLLQRGESNSTAATTTSNSPPFEKGGPGGISAEEQPFELPQEWEWTTLASISLVNPRNNAEDNSPASFVPMTMIGTKFNSLHDQEARLWKEIKQGFTHFAEGDIGVAKITPCFENSKACVFSGLLSGVGAGTTELHVVRPINATLAPRYVLAYLKSPQFLLIGETRMTGTAGQKRLPKDFVELNPFPMPPLGEQHRIVAKVDELMALCDQLEAQHNNAAEAHEKLVSHLLGTLTQSQSAEDLTAREGGNAENAGAIFGQSSWQRIAAHFDTLFTTETSIDALKQTLLQLAVMGKLVPQEPNDEPASELLKRIQAEKAKLIADGKIKKDKPLPLITDEEKPFELPVGWEWVRLDELASLITKGSSPKWQGVSYTVNTDDVMFVTSENVGRYSLLLDSPKYVEKKFNDIEPRSILINGDFLMNIVGASIGRTAVYDLDTLANINQAVCLIRISTAYLSSMFLLHFFNSETCLEYMFDKQVDNARPNLSMGNIAKFLMPIPPLSEQHRIVAKVDELMALCDQLKSRITESNQLQKKLADVMVERAIS